MIHVGLLIVSLALATASAQTSTPSMVYGTDFSPYENGQDPNLNPQIPVSQILSRMQVVAPYTKWVRSFSSTNGLENVPSVARQLGLKVAANAWISSNAAQNTVEISNLIAAANAGLVDVAIVGSEAILRNDVSVSQLIAYMNQVRLAIPHNIPVTTADVYGTFLAQPALIAASDIVFANFYPYWEGTSINNAMCSLEQEYQQLVAASGSKAVVISETGWPSAGNAVGAAVPSPANANLFALQFFSWAGANNIPAFYFEAFDESWKAAYEGPQGAHWGIFDISGVIKPGMDAFFNGQTTAVACNGPIPGPVGIGFTYVPPYGSSDVLEAQVTGVQPASYAVATYIEVAGAWWTKPTFAQPTVAINPDGTVRIPIVTGGSDQLATNIAAFLIPSSVAPPAVGGGALPTIPSAVAAVQASRTPSSISGTITDNLGGPISGVTISDPVLGSTSSAADGKYSFYHITTSGTATLSVSYPNYNFPTSPSIVAISSGNQLMNFTGIPTVDLSVISTVSPNPAQTGSNVVETIIASNAAPASASDAVVTVPIPTFFTLVSASTTRGSCTTATLPVTCDIGGLASTAYATITVVATPNAAGIFNFLASVSGPDPDSNPANNSTSLALTVQAPSAQMTTPAPGSVLPSPSATFTWTAIAGADQYWLDVGSAVGIGDYFGAATTGTSASVNSLPCDARTVYVQLWTHISGNWQTPARYTYTAAGECAALTSPANNAVFSSTSVTFTWNAISGADQYWVDVGNSIGHGDVFGGSIPATSVTVNNLPCDGRTLYGQLWTHSGGVWHNPGRYNFVASTGACSVPLTPTPGSVLASPSATFTWIAIAGADQYWLDVGSAVGIGDYFGAATTGTSASVNSLPCDARTVYVQLWTHINGNWQPPARYTYTAAGGCAALTSPANSAVFSNTSVTFTWNAISGADQYWLDVGNSIGQGDIFGGSTTSTGITVNNIPCDSRTLYGQLWTHSGGVWHNPGRYNFVASSACGKLTTPSPGSTLPGSTVTFNWNAGTGATAYWLDVGTVLGQGNIYGANVGTALSHTVSGIPANGSVIYVQLWSQIGGVWYLNRYLYTAF